MDDHHRMGVGQSAGTVFLVVAVRQHGSRRQPRHLLLHMGVVELLGTVLLGMNCNAGSNEPRIDEE